MKIADLFVELRARGLATVQGQLAGLKVSLAKVGTAFNGINRVARRALLVVGGALGLAAKAAMDFEKQLAMVNTMLDQADANYLPAYARGLQSLSKEFGQSTATLSKGLYDILSASVAPAEALNVLRVATKAAAGGFTDTAITADAITTILNSYGMAASRAAEVSDLLFATVKRGKLTMEELASGIGKAAATSAVAGLSLEELFASIATITRAGISSDQAMTSVVGVLRSFLKPTTEAKELAKSLGFELSTASLKAEGFSGVFAKINKLSAEQLAVLFPNIRGLKGVAAAMQDLTGFAKDVDMMFTAYGRTEEAFLKRQGTLEFQLGRTKQAFIGLFRAMGESLLPALKNIVAWLGKLVNAMTRNSDKILNVITTIGKWALKIVIVIGGVKALAAALGILNLVLSGGALGIFLKLAGVALAAYAAYKAWGAAVEYADGAINKFIDSSENLADKLENMNNQLKDSQDGAKSLVVELADLVDAGSGTESALNREAEIITKLISLYPSLASSLNGLGKDRVANIKIIKDTVAAMQELQKVEQYDLQKRKQKAAFVAEDEAKANILGLREQMKREEITLAGIKQRGARQAKDIQKQGIVKYELTGGDMSNYATQYDASKERSKELKANLAKETQALRDARDAQARLVDEGMAKEEIKKRMTPEISGPSMESLKKLQEERTKQFQQIAALQIQFLQEESARERAALKLKHAIEIQEAVAAGKDLTLIYQRQMLERALMEREIQKKTAKEQQDEMAKAAAALAKGGEIALKQEEADKRGKGGGQFGGVAEQYRRIQSGFMAGDIQKNQLKTQKEIAREIAELNDKMGGVGGVGV